MFGWMKFDFGWDRAGVRVGHRIEGSSILGKMREQCGKMLIGNHF